MNKLLLYLCVANLLDGLFTLIGLHFHLIAESNNLMQAVYDKNPLLFFAIKIVLSLSLLVLAIKLRNNRKAVLFILARFAAVAYSFVIFLHAIWIIQLF